MLVFAGEAFDCNCASHITPRWTAEEIARAIEGLETRLAELESEVARLRAEGGA